MDLTKEVSILAPLARGALLIYTKLCQYVYRFQSSPLSQEGRYNRKAPARSGDGCFNPRPSRKRGATAGRSRPAGRQAGFNPRPSRKRGATRAEKRRRARVAVSILAPLARGALLHYPIFLFSTFPFQSSPLSQEGRYRTTKIFHIFR